MGLKKSWPKSSVSRTRSPPASGSSKTNDAFPPRMIAGPNGSGKSTLFEYLRTQTTYRLGHCLNPDLLERDLAQAGRVSFGAWNVSVDDDALHAFMTAHPLASKAPLPTFAVQENTLTISL